MFREYCILQSFRRLIDMEYALLIKVTTAINYIVNSGYLIAGGYMLKTIIRYVKDYKESVLKESIENNN